MKKNKGSILVFALIVLSFVLIAAFTVASVTLVERRNADVSVHSSTAFQNADKGMEEFLQQLYKDLDQNDNLTDMASALRRATGDAYTCVHTGAVTVPATIGDTNTPFIISAYKEIQLNDPDSAGWDNNELEPITNCDEQLANVARFKVAGNYSAATRAVFVKLRDSLTRGLIAHWSFEDRAQVARLKSDDDDKVSYIAQDSSKNDHVLTLCHPRDDSVRLEDEGKNYVGDVKKFDECEANSDAYMIPQKRGTCDECDEDGAWAGGIVHEIVEEESATGDTSVQEALYFDGDDYLAMWTKSSCDAEAFNCVDGSSDEDQLKPTDAISISLWVKTKDNSAFTARQTLLSRFDSNKGYQMYFDNTGKICFVLNDTTVCTDDKYNDGKWHLAVGRWRSDPTDNNMELFVDDKYKKGNSLSSLSAASGPVYVGTSKYDAATTDFFVGTIDDVRIWDRAVTDVEVNRLCVLGQKDNTDPTEVTCYDAS